MESPVPFWLKQDVFTASRYEENYKISSLCWEDQCYYETRKMQRYSAGTYLWGRTTALFSKVKSGFV